MNKGKDCWDLRPDENEIRGQRWAEVGGQGDVPAWHGVYRQEFHRIKGLNAEEIDFALDQSVTSAGNEWAHSDPESNRVWAEKVKANKESALGKKQALLYEIRAARQNFYATRRQETVYRGKVILLSTGALVGGLLSLILWICYLTCQNKSTDSLSPAQGTVLALLCGWCGGSFTWLVANRRAVAGSLLGVLREISRWPYSISRATIGAFSGLVIYAALACNVVSNPTPALFTDRASVEERERAREAFRAIAQAANPSAAAAGEVKFLRELDTKFREVRSESDQWWLQKTGVMDASPAQAGHLTATIAASLRRTVDPFWMLVFVCILAGFSETLVPNLLTASEKKLESALK